MVSTFLCILLLSTLLVAILEISIFDRFSESSIRGLARLPPGGYAAMAVQSSSASSSAASKFPSESAVTIWPESDIKKIEPGKKEKTFPNKVGVT